MTEVASIPISQIEPGDNDRQVFDRQKLEDLAASIQQNGLAQPITVRPIATRCPRCNKRYAAGDGLCFACTDTMMVTVPVYQIVAGERRFRAISQVLGWPTVPAIIRKLTDEEASAIMLVENTSREDLNPIDEATAYLTRQQVYDWSVDRIAETAGKSPDLVKRRLSLLDLTPDIQRLVATGNLPIGHAEAMTRLDTNRQRMALRILQEGGNPSLATFRAIVSRLYEEQAQDCLIDLSTFYIEQLQAQHDAVLRGKGARVDVPVRHDLPEPSKTGSVSDVIRSYIHALLDAGKSDEAGVVGKLYQSLVHSNHIRVTT